MNKGQLEVLIRHLHEVKRDIAKGIANPADIVNAHSKLSEIIDTLEKHYQETEEL